MRQWDSETVGQWDSEIAIRCPPTAGNSHSECSEESWCMTVVTQLSVNTDRREGSEGSEGSKGSEGCGLPFGQWVLYAASRRALRSYLPVVILHRSWSKRKIPLWAGPFLRKGLREAVGIGPKFDVPILRRLTTYTANTFCTMRTGFVGKRQRPENQVSQWQQRMKEQRDAQNVVSRFPFRGHPLPEEGSRKHHRRLAPLLRPPGRHLPLWTLCTLWVE